MDELTSSQLSEWEAYAELEPIGAEEQQEIRLARLLSWMDNRVKSMWLKSGSYTFSDFKDFLPLRMYTPPPPKTQTAEEQKMIFQTMLHGKGPMKKGRKKRHG